MISKKLLCSVLQNNRVSSDGYKQLDDNIIHFDCVYGNAPDDYYDEVECINIYELSHKCKEWAYSLGYDLVTTNTSTDSNYCQYCYILSKDWRFGVDDFNDRIAYKSGLNEPESIFKCCQWILDNNLSSNT